MPAHAHLKVALTTNSLVQVDAGFADARQVVFYRVSRDNVAFEDAVKFHGAPRAAAAVIAFADRPAGAVKPGMGRNGGACMMAEDLAADAAAGDMVSNRVALLAGCSILITRGISDLAAMRVKSADIFPVKTEGTHEIDSVLDRLQALLRGNPPLWLRRVLRDEQGRAVPLDDQGL
jgi:nitrogen fixation protein NifX